MPSFEPFSTHGPFFVMHNVQSALMLFKAKALKPRPPQQNDDRATCLAHASCMPTRAHMQLRDRNAEKILRMGRGELSVYDELFRCFRLSAVLARISCAVMQCLAYTWDELDGEHGECTVVCIQARW